MEKMILEHIEKRDIPSEWIKYFDDFLSSTYRITIEPETMRHVASEIGTNKSWRDMPLFGMWKERDDMTDPAGFVRQLRKPRF